MDVNDFLIKYGTYDELAAKIAELVSDSSDESIEVLADFLRIKDTDTNGKHITPKLATIGLINLGKRGIDRLISIYSEIDGHIYPKSILDCLWFASNNLLMHFADLFHLKIIDPLHTTLDEETVKLVRDVFCDIVLSSSNNDELLSTFVENTIIYKDFLLSKGIDVNISDDIITILSETSLKISNILISKFSMLIEMQSNEEQYQKFLKDNPIFLESTAFSVFDKHKLGDDLITDFVIETLVNDYYVVEIEKPQDNIFNKNGDFSGKFTHALGQVLDFIDWIESNIAYTQKKLPGIVSPKGILVMGRSNQLNNEEIRKLQRFNKNSNSITVLTYDDLVLKAKCLYKNLLHV